MCLNHGDWFVHPDSMGFDEHSYDSLPTDSRIDSCNHSTIYPKSNISIVEPES